MGGIRHPHRRQVSCSQAPGQLLRIFPVSLHPFSGLHWHQAWRYHFTVHSQCHPVANTIDILLALPHNRLAVAPRLPASLLTSESDSFGIVPRECTAPSVSATATAIVSAWTSKPTNLTLFIDRLLSLVALRCGLPDSQRNPRAAKQAGRSMMTIRS